MSLKKFIRIHFSPPTYKGVNVSISIFGNQWQQQFFHSPVDEQHGFMKADEGYRQISLKHQGDN